MQQKASEFQEHLAAILITSLVWLHQVVVPLVLSMLSQGSLVLSCRSKLQMPVRYLASCQAPQHIDKQCMAAVTACTWSAARLAHENGLSAAGLLDQGGCAFRDLSAHLQRSAGVGETITV